MIRCAGISLLVSLAVSCTRGLDPCPEGSSLTGDQCAVQEGVRAQDAGKSPRPIRDAAAEPDADESDADAAQDDAGDVDIDATLPDADIEIDAAEADADNGGLDAEADARPPPPADAAADAGRDAASTCETQDQERWRDLHLSSALITQIGSCWQPDAGCSVDACPMLQCLRQNLGILSCDVCIAEEGACVAAACAERCGASTDNEACRACACSRGCVAAFETCSSATLDVCADCNETTCTNTSGLAPELIITVLNQLLL